MLHGVDTNIWLLKLHRICVVCEQTTCWFWLFEGVTHVGLYLFLSLNGNIRVQSTF